MNKNIEIQDWDSSLQRELDRLFKLRLRRVSIGWWVGKVYRFRVVGVECKRGRD